MKGTKIYSIATSTCPVCHTGDMYKYNNPYLVSKALKMHERCPHCNTKFKIEPSFFYGAMYVSYAVGVAFAVAAFVISFFFIGLGRFETFLAIVGTLIVFLPVILRLSRNIWINFFFKYDPAKAA
ncbi:MAG: DUF983 domain-containing protein [Flavobacteriaceae bacterium]|nr:DUF983 domain-containing protein [Flavobacteriaceae bacterium]|tara:strand:+ start:148 stop:522 length:375 start_codon:yes stop_codon:yes gene_type:complete